PGDDDDLGVKLTACLPQTAADTAAPPDELPPWQMLNAQAPKVAHIYKILAEGQKNPALDKFNQLKLNGALNEAPEYAPSLARWLHLCGKGSWVSGRLLETLVDQWLAQPKAIDPALLAGLLQPGLVEKYTVSDWLALAQLCWLPDYQSLWPLSGQPALNTRRRLQVLDVAKTRLAQYTTPAQAHRLATACRNWGLSADELAELVAAAPAPACNFSLLHPYLYNDGTAIAPGSHVSQTLILQALQLAPADPAEQAQLRLFVTQIVKQQLQHAADVATLIAWADRAANSKVWQNALTAAAADLAPEQFSLLVGRAHRLKRQGAANLCRALVAALDAYWAGQKQTLK
ncbi:MAG: hypothetical protein ACE5G8_18420, partial [Anaerolineae bacterium]